MENLPPMWVITIGGEGLYIFQDGHVGSDVGSAHDIFFDEAEADAKCAMLANAGLFAQVDSYKLSQGCVAYDDIIETINHEAEQAKLMQLYDEGLISYEDFIAKGGTAAVEIVNNEGQEMNIWVEFYRIDQSPDYNDAKRCGAVYTLTSTSKGDMLCQLYALQEVADCFQHEGYKDLSFKVRIEGIAEPVDQFCDWSDIKLAIANAGEKEYTVTFTQKYEYEKVVKVMANSESHAYIKADVMAEDDAAIPMHTTGEGWVMKDEQYNREVSE